MEGKPLEIGDADFNREVLEAEGPVLVDFWAPWCGPCKMVAPVVEELAKEFAGKVKVVKVNVDENTDSPSRYSVMSIPTLILFKDGQALETMVGFKPKDELADKIKAHL
ncbi:MAG: thioredoxin [Firmicutes bacterium]|nr:thioredoxin [Bacillota bacterium]